MKPCPPTRILGCSVSTARILGARLLKEAPVQPVAFIGITTSDQSRWIWPLISEPKKAAQ